MTSLLTLKALIKIRRKVRHATEAANQEVVRYVQLVSSVPAVPVRGPRRQFSWINPASNGPTVQDLFSAVPIIRARDADEAALMASLSANEAEEWLGVPVIDCVPLCRRAAQ